MHIELHRNFRELLRDVAQGDDARALSPGTTTLTLPSLLTKLRVVILSEAGSGKTEEIREATRQLRKDGKAAFFMRLEHVTIDFDTAFEEGSLEEFQAWLASSEPGWMLLDSIDESRLRSPLDFEAAMRRISGRLATAKQRMHLLITGRAPAWRPKTDLELCDKLFPVTEKRVVAAIAEDVEPTVEHRQATLPLAERVSSFEIVTLEDLSAEQIKHFAKMKGIGSTQAFLDAIERADAWSFTARPQDLDELTGFWLDNGAIGSRLELMQNSVNRRLREKDQTRAEALPLASDKALSGAQIIAAALVLTNQQTIKVPDGGKSVVQGLELNTVLLGWEEKAMTTLLQRPLFAPDIYGTVRFHHRSVREYLAAQWFLKLLSQEVSRRKVEELFFREQYGLEVVVPSLRPLLPWLAMADERILARVRRIAPEIVFEGGDPVQLPGEIRSSMLEQICDQLDSGASMGLMADFAAVQRFAAPDLTSTLRRLTQKFKANDDIVFFLMRMIWQGRLNGALPETMDIACSPVAGYASRIAAFRAIADLGTLQDMALIRQAFIKEGHTLNGRCLADLISHVEHPNEQTLGWLLDCIPRLAEYNEYEDTGLSEEIALFFERAPLEIVDLGIDGLYELLILSPDIKCRHSEISERYQWLRQAAGVAVRRLINARNASALKLSSLSILHLLPLDGRYNARTFDVKELGLAEAVQQWQELKWALFWHVVEQKRKCKAEKGERLIDVWMALVSAVFVSFDDSDFDASVRAVRERTFADDKLVALSLAFRLYLQTGRQRSRNAQLKKAVGEDDTLKMRLSALMKPPKKSDELKRMERENARWSRRAAAHSARQEKNRLETAGKLEAQMDTLRNPGFDDPSAVSQAQFYLFNRMRRLEENKGSQWTNSNWRSLEREFGTKTPRSFRDGMVRFWRGHSPKLVSEGAALNATPIADLFGLAGLSIEAAETPGLFWSLKPAEAAVAFRYAMSELNGFPNWFAALSDAHLDVVKAMVLTEVMFELQGDQEDAPSHYVISNLSRVGDWLWDALAPEIVKLLRTHPPKSSDRLLHLLDVVQASKLPDATIAALAAEKMVSVIDPKHLPLWAATWTGVDPGPAIDAVEAALAALGNEWMRTEFMMSYVTHLLGGRHALSRVRAGFRSPAVLKRLYILVHQHVRSREDIDRANMGVYSPGLRDNAQDARERLVSILREIPGRDAYLALKVISEEHPESSLRPWFARQARSKAEADSERPAWSAEQVSQFDKEFERTPANHRELFDLAVLRLLDLKYELEDGDASTASVLIKAELETVARNYIGAWCSKSSLGRYVIPQEEELPDAKRPDFRWHCVAFKGPVPTELKIADNWTGPQLFERLERQLAGDYLRDEASSRGIYLLVYRGLQKRWGLPSGGWAANFEQLVAELQGHWVSVATTHQGVEEIKVIGIDLTKRAKVLLPKKRPGKQTVAKKAAAESIRKSSVGTKVMPSKKVPVKKASVKSVTGEKRLSKIAPADKATTVRRK